MRRALTILLALCSVWLAAGCKQPAAETAAASPATAEAGFGERPGNETASSGPSVAVKAYINVSSGCQQTTVDLLQQLDQQNDRLALELIDFGSAAGNLRWRQDGLNCMTILINGHQTVTFGQPGHRRIVTFSFPPGFQWIHEDLSASIADALAGRLYYGEEPGAVRLEARGPTLRITGREAVLGGRKVGEVVINGQIAIRFRTTYDGLPPLQRAEQAAARIKRLLAGEFSPDQLKVAEADGQTVLAAQDKIICVADKPQAQLLGTTPKDLAKGWATALRKALVAALGGG